MDTYKGISIERLDVAWDEFMRWQLDTGRDAKGDLDIDKIIMVWEGLEPSDISDLLARVLAADDLRI